MSVFDIILYILLGIMVFPMWVFLGCCVAHKMMLWDKTDSVVVAIILIVLWPFTLLLDFYYYLYKTVCELLGKGED